MKKSTKMIRWASAIVIVCALLFNVSLMNAGGGTEICHCDGNDEEGIGCNVDIAIGQAAVDIHLAHGDCVGACPCETPKTPTL